MANNDIRKVSELDFIKEFGQYKASTRALEELNLDFGKANIDLLVDDYEQNLKEWSHDSNVEKNEKIFDECLNQEQERHNK